ncbi:MAG: LysR family transcriptional regulator [Gemmatimonadaceae bacterium]|jgi:DNA-binding transcriptional LysR family regulator|nr:LysR family transcriptional regulator [Gemmatimonadaceae bacterium]
MIQLSDLEFFATLAQSPSLAAAARALNVSSSAVTQRLQDLERRVGAQLIDRRSRRVELTDEGELLATQGRVITEAVVDLGEALSAKGDTVRGRLRVVAPIGFGRAHVAPIIAAFATQHPSLAVELTLTDRLQRHPMAQWDLAILIGTRRDARVTMRTLAPNERLLVAAPSYLARAGVPQAPRDLLAHACLVVRENDEDVTLWTLHSETTGTTRVRITPRLASNDGDVAREWALAGHGILLRSEWSVADDLRTGRLVRVLPGYRAPSADILLLLNPTRARTKRSERFVEALTAALTPAPWRVAE